MLIQAGNGGAKHQGGSSEFDKNNNILAIATIFADRLGMQRENKESRIMPRNFP